MSQRKSYPVARGVAPPPGHKPPHADTQVEIVVPVIPIPELLVPFALDEAPPLLQPIPARRWLSRLVLLFAMTAVVAACTAVGWVTVGRHRAPSAVAVARIDKSVAPASTTVGTPKVPAPAGSTEPKAEAKPASAAKAEPKATAPPPAASAVPTPVAKAPPKTPTKAPTTNLTFARDIQPILKQRCETCHGFMGKIKGGLDLRTLSAAFKGGDGGPVVVAGSPEKSPLVERVADGSMPPSGKKVPDADLDKIKRWIAGGAK